MLLENVIFKGQGRVAFAIEKLKNELFFEYKSTGKIIKKTFFYNNILIIP